MMNRIDCMAACLMHSGKAVRIAVLWWHNVLLAACRGGGRGVFFRFIKIPLLSGSMQGSFRFWSGNVVAFWMFIFDTFRVLADNLGGLGFLSSSFL